MNLNRLRSLIFAAVVTTTAATSFAGVFVSVTVAPPALPVYAQPPCPGDGYIWTPGYWAYGPNGYSWVAGAWVLAPHPGYLWTPGYWAWSDGIYVWHRGYWGLHVGFYGGVNYGFGYTGFGFHGGYWEGDRFYYNRSVTNVNITNVHNTYTKEVTVNNYSRHSFNGPGGVRADPKGEELRAAHEKHVDARPEQFHHERALASTHPNRPEKTLARAEAPRFYGGKPGFTRPFTSSHPAVHGRGSSHVAEHHVRR